MKKGKERSLFFLGVISIILLMAGISEASFEGTIGTEFTISGSGFGSKKPSVYLEVKTPTKTQKISAKVENWSDTILTCLWTKKLPPGTYNLMVKPNIKGGVPIHVDTFTIMNPEIIEFRPGSGSVGDKITMHGRFLTNKPKVYLENALTLKRKTCKVLNPTMDPLTGISSLQFVVPNLRLGENEQYDLVVKNLVGETYVSFPEPSSPTTAKTTITGIVSPPLQVSLPSFTIVSPVKTSSITSRGTYTTEVYGDGVAVVAAMPQGKEFGLMNVVSMLPADNPPLNLQRKRRK